ncbi:MAG: GNAT family protein [Candidatus Lokiarchaeota archaeon]
MNFNLKIIKEKANEKVKLRKIDKKDEKFLYKNLKNPDVTRYISLHLTSLSNSRKLVKKYLKYWKSLIQFVYIIEYQNEKEEIVRTGAVNIWNIKWKHKRAEIGIWISPKYWNKGIGTQALSLLESIAFNYLKLIRLEAHIALPNKKSIYLFEKCDFDKEGLLRSYMKIRDEFYDSYIFAKINKKE